MEKKKKSFATEKEEKDQKQKLHTVHNNWDFGATPAAIFCSFWSALAAISKLISAILNQSNVFFLILGRQPQSALVHFPTDPDSLDDLAFQAPSHQVLCSVKR